MRRRWDGRLRRSALWREGLLPAFCHEGLGGQTIEFGEPRRDVREHWLDEQTSTGAADSNAVPLEPEFARQSHRLTSPVPEQLCGCDHEGVSSIYTARPPAARTRLAARDDLKPSCDSFKVEGDSRSFFILALLHPARLFRQQLTELQIR